MRPYIKHGESHKNVTKEYRSWYAIKQRCTNPKHKSFKNYGGAGITICERWSSSYINFLSDMGRAPSSNHSVDRINNKLGYLPGNCKWATPNEQSYNRSTNVVVKFMGQSRPIKQWCDILNLNYYRVRSRINRGWSVPDAFFKIKYSQ